LQAERPDVVHVNCLPHVRGARVARRLGVPVVWHVREILPPGMRRCWFAWRLRRDATRIVAVSEAVAGWLRGEGLGDRTTVVHNGVRLPAELPESAAARARLRIPDGVPVIGLFSQLVAHKGALDFVAAAHRMAGISDGWFLIAGQGPHDFMARVKRAIAAGPAANRIQLLPPQPEIWPLLAAVDAVAVTTLWPDPLPRVVMEAMAAGLPVVGYRGGGVPEMVEDGETGLLCEPGDVDGLTAIFARVAADAALRERMGDAGSRRVREKFSIGRHVDQMEQVLRAAVG
jgi:glycosyltransferase involved in cell wall biosynthesis